MNFIASLYKLLKGICCTSTGISKLALKTTLNPPINHLISQLGGGGDGGGAGNSIIITHNEFNNFYDRQ
jgi:hypothetical protein